MGTGGNGCGDVGVSVNTCVMANPAVVVVAVAESGRLGRVIGVTGTTGRAVDRIVGCVTMIRVGNAV